MAAETGRGYLEAAGQADRFAIGSDIDQRFLGSFVLTSAVKHVDMAVQAILGDVQAGKFRGGDHRYGLADGAVGLAPTSADVPSKVVSQARSYADRIVAGKIHPPESVPARQ